MKHRPYRVNNLRLRWNRLSRKWAVHTLDGRNLEEFDSDRDAVLWMQETKDFLTPFGRIRKYGQ